MCTVVVVTVMLARLALATLSGKPARCSSVQACPSGDRASGRLPCGSASAPWRARGPGARPPHFD